MALEQPAFQTPKASIESAIDGSSQTFRNIRGMVRARPVFSRGPIDAIKKEPEQQ